MQRRGNLYTLGFAAVICIICSIIVSTASVALRERQQENIILDRQINVLTVAGLIEVGERIGAEEAQRRFDENIELRIIELETGEYADDAVRQPYDPVEAARDSELGRRAPANRAGISYLPRYAIVHHVMEDGEIDMIVIQVWGSGLWGMMYGYLAFDSDGVTIRGITFYEHEETPGLGGEVDNPRWKAHWEGREAYDDDWQLAIVMRKAGAGPPEEDPHGFDAISGATFTSRGVEALIRFWLGEHGYGPYLKRYHNNNDEQEDTTVAMVAPSGI